VPRRFVSRCVAGALAFAMVVAGFDAPAADASPAPTSLVSVDGFLTTVSSSDPDLLVVNYTVTVQGEGVTDAKLVTGTFASAPVDPTTVQVDGTAAPSPTITQTPGQMTIRLGTGADATNGGALSIGSYLVSYQQQRPTGVSKSAATSATVSFTRAGQPGSVTSNSVALTHPDITLRIPARSGEDRAALLGTGRIAAYGAYLGNRGATAAAATLTLTLPDGLRLDTIDGVQRIDFTKNGDGADVPVKCTHTLSATVTCDLSAIPHAVDSVLLVPVIATKSAKPGTRSAFHLRITPNGEPDQDPSNNALTGRVKFTGIARLKCSLISRVTKVEVGKKVTVKVRIHNLGPQPAGYAYGIVISNSRHFVISKFLTNRHPKSGRKFVRIPAPPELGSVLQWNAGSIGAHSTAYARLILTAKSVGESLVQFFGDSAAGNPGCDTGFGNCRALDTLTLHAVKKQPATKSANVEQN
jgi:hypothetical protein